MALIYVVEDDKNIQEIETFALANVGYEVKGFDSAMDFYEALNDTTPDLILLDIMLPDEDGLEIVGKLRRRPETKKLPATYQTGHGAGAGDHGHGEDHGDRQGQGTGSGGR